MSLRGRQIRRFTRKIEIYFHMSPSTVLIRWKTWVRYQFESIFCLVSQGKTRFIDVGSSYRPPSYFTDLWKTKPCRLVMKDPTFRVFLRRTYRRKLYWQAEGPKLSPREQIWNHRLGHPSRVHKDFRRRPPEILPPMRGEELCVSQLKQVSGRYEGNPLRFDSSKEEMVHRR